MNEEENETLKAKLAKIQAQIHTFEVLYNGTFDGLYGHLNSVEIDGLDEAFDVFEWKELLEIKTMLEQKILAEG